MAAEKKDKLDYTTSQLFNFARDSYLERTSRPVYAILFLLPFIVFYEIGTILLNTDVLNRTQIRVVAFVWLQDLLRYLGTGNRFAWLAPPLVVVVILLGLQIASRKPWWFCLGDFGPMILECVLLAVPLIVLSLFFNSSTADPSKAAALDRALPAVCAAYVRAEPMGPPGEGAVPPVQSAAGPATGRSLMASIVTSVGAGIYEELVFRLILICALMVLFQDLFGLDHRNAIILSVLISSALFSAHHHHIAFINGQLGRGAAFTWTEFIFRTVAGIYFAALFAIRGFGITAGTHASYDIIATILNAFFFGR
jgi:hypothetical protein